MRRRAILIWLLAFVASSMLVFKSAQANSTIGQWSLGPFWPVSPINMLLLPNAKVMFYPGNGVSGDAAYVWDPATGTVNALAQAGYDIFCSGHSFMQDGRILVTGGHIATYVGLPNASVYNPFTNVWTRAPDMNAGRWYPTTTTMGNGEVLVMTGYIDNVQLENALPQVWQPASQTWRNLTGAQLKIPAYSWVFLHRSSKAIVVGPSRDTRLLDTSGTGQWTSLTSLNYPGFRDYGSAVMWDPLRVLVAGGGQPPTNTAEVINLSDANPTWQYTGAMAFARRHMNLVLLPDDNVLAVGGTRGDGFNDTSMPVYAAEMWNADTGLWTTMASQSVGRFYHSTAMLLPDGRVLSSGGDNTYQAEIYSPPYLFKGARPVVTSAPGHAQYGQTFFVGTPDAANITKVRLIRLPAVTHAFDQNQRLIRLSYSATANGLNVSAPVDPNLVPPGHYMLFIVNNSSVPSAAQIIQIDNTAGSDTTPPTISIIAPASGTTVSGVAVTVSAAASDNVAVAGVQFKLDGVNLGTEDTVSPYSITWNSKTAANGPHTLTALARDAAGNTNTSTPVSVTVDNPADTIPPTVSIDTPANGATVSGLAVTVSATASDDVAVAGVQFKLDGANLGAEDTTAPYSAMWNSMSASNGSHTLTAIARDPAGNSTTSTPVSVTVNNVSSCAQTLLNVSGAGSDGGFAYIIVGSFGTPADNGSHLTQSTLRLFENSENILELGPAHSPHVDIRNLGLGRFSHWSATDGTGESLRFAASDNTNPRTNGRGYSYCVSGTPQDTTPPTVSITTPASGATVSGVAVTVSATASDNVGVAGVQFKLDGVNLGAEDTTSPYSVTWNSTSAANGSHALAAVARDAAGNSTTSTLISITVNNAQDTTAPTVSITAPASGATVSGVAVTVSAAASDNVGVAGVQFKLDGVNLGAEDTTSPYSVTWNSTSAANGPHTLTAVARDAAGNNTTSTPISVTVNNAQDTTAPTVSITSPASGATITTTVVTVSATASDNVGVVGVQFKLDGADLGGEDTSAPYSVNWNTRSGAEGAHTLTAVARDAAGNTATSAPISVTVQRKK